MDFKNKKVLIAGSTKGIGLAIAKKFLEHGAKVYVTARNEVSISSIEVFEKYKKNVFFKQCDFTSTEKITQLKNEVKEFWNNIDILVYNVGSGKSVLNPISEMSDFNKVFDLNFHSAVNTTREFLPQLQNSQGCIIFIASICGLEAINAPTDYSVAKSALISFSKNLSKKVASQGIRVNCIAPGNIYFEGGVWDQKLKANPDFVKKMLETNVPMNRFGTPEEVADACLFLCSDKSTFITGNVLVVDGGQTNRAF